MALVEGGVRRILIEPLVRMARAEGRRFKNKERFCGSEGVLSTSDRHVPVRIQAKKPMDGNPPSRSIAALRSRGRRLHSTIKRLLRNQNQSIE
jgi:hypothetical protein